MEDGPDLPAAPAPGGPPLILFDGVCNLCSAAVQWVIERDRRGRFRFASLQSGAAARELSQAEAPEPLPDSIVLIDRAGVHMRSTAALRIARHLGFPYTLLIVLMLVPRPLRDLAYGVVARHRYRWFGRRDTCMMPTPALAARFYDADEPRTQVPLDEPDGRPAPGPDSITDRRASWAGVLLTRFSIVYLIVYIAPFPLTMLALALQLPSLEHWMTDGQWAKLQELVFTIISSGDPLQHLVPWVGEHVLGVEAALEFTGSGDRTFHYVEALIDVVFAGTVTALWMAIRGARRVPGALFELTRILCRYYLATTMLTYGWIKLYPLQFPVPGPERLMQPYGDSSPMGIAWTFLGASTGYQMFAGLSELVGGYLLFFRRTTLLGALVTAAVMANVAAINFFYDVPVKLFSTHLILVALFVAIPDLPRLLGLLVLQVPIAAARLRAPWARWRGLALVMLLLKLGLIVVLTSQHVSTNRAAMQDRGPWAEPHPLAGIYRVESFARNGLEGRANEDGVRWVRMGLTPPFVATVQHASGDAVRMRLVVDDEARTMSLFPRGGEAPPEPAFAYSSASDGRLRLEGAFGDAELVVVLRREENPSLLLSRGFRWINEYPFNR